MEMEDRRFDLKLNWSPTEDNLVEDFYKPALLNYEKYQIRINYFSSTSFAYVANEILEFIENNGRIQLITNQNLPKISKKLLDATQKISWLRSN